MVNKIEFFHGVVEITPVGVMKEKFNMSAKQILDYKKDIGLVNDEDAEKMLKTLSVERKSSQRKVSTLNKNLPYKEITDREQFRLDLEERGVKFCKSCYGLNLKQLRAEADRLQLKLEWDMLPR